MIHKACRRESWSFTEATLNTTRSSFWTKSHDLLHACYNGVQQLSYQQLAVKHGQELPGQNTPKHLFFTGWVKGVESWTWNSIILHPATLCQLHCCSLLGLLQLLVLAPSPSYAHSVLCVPNPSIVLLISLLSKDTVSVHGLLEAPLKAWLGELVGPPSVSTLQSEETHPDASHRHALQGWAPLLCRSQITSLPVVWGLMLLPWSWHHLGNGWKLNTVVLDCLQCGTCCTFDTDASSLHKSKSTSPTMTF